MVVHTNASVAVPASTAREPVHHKPASIAEILGIGGKHPAKDRKEAPTGDVAFEVIGERTGIHPCLSGRPIRFDTVRPSGRPGAPFRRTA